MKAVAIIPARGGSKRIPRKNIRLFNGLPMIAYTIRKALDSGLFDAVIVSTDDEEIATIAKAYGAEVPFLRSAENSSDTATTAAVLTEILGQLKQSGRVFEHACCLYPTAPLLPEPALRSGFELLQTAQFDSVISVCRFSYPIQRSLKAEGNLLTFAWPENRSVRSQDLETHYHDAGQFYWFKTAGFEENKQLFTDKTGFVELQERYVQDIDNEEDWLLAEIKYAFIQQHEKR